MPAFKRRIEDKIRRAFYDYGKLCSSHSVACLSLSVMSSLLLSYPAMSKIELPSSSPIDIFWHTSLGKTPEWYDGQPAFFVQQVVVRSVVDPWNEMETSPDTAVRASILHSFQLHDIIESIISHNDCVRVNQSAWPSQLKHGDCIIFSPALFWNKDKDAFSRTRNVHEAIFDEHCTESLCERDVFLGSVWWRTGIKTAYQTNRQRSIEVALTFLLKHNPSDLRTRLNDLLTDRFAVRRSRGSDENVNVHVFYRPGHYFADYFPIIATYILCAVYFYYTVKKFEMVKSKIGLAMASFACVLTTLTSTLGICQHFGLIASVDRARLFPYLAMLLSLENTLCITRSVVYTPPSLDVSSRISHGLAHESVSLAKFFLAELGCLLIGYLTRVHDIQEFCAFAFITIVVDLYLQLFFYAPCLTFDLWRMNEKDKERFSLMLFNTDVRKLEKYNNPQCPMRQWMPQLFSKKKMLMRTLSGQDLNAVETFKKGHRRVMSSVERNSTPSVRSNRLLILYHWTRTRIAVRIIMVSFCVWVVYLVLFVHKWNGMGASEGIFVSQRILDTAPLEWGHWTKGTFFWWPRLAHLVDVDLAGRFITFLPTMAVDGVIPWDHEDLAVQVEDAAMSNVHTHVDHTTSLQHRVDWLEREISRLLLLSVLLPFLVTVAFLFYMCFWERWLRCRQNLSSAFCVKKHDSKTGPRTLELAPQAFSRHEYPVECASTDSQTIVSASTNGQVFIWDAQTGELRNSLTRRSLQSHSRQGLDETSPVPSEPGTEVENQKRTRSSVWCISVSHPLVALGCSDGSVQLGHLESGIMLATIDGSIGISEDLIICARLNGTVDSMECIVDNVLVRLSSSNAHKKSITQLLTSTTTIVTASYDHSLRVMDPTSLHVRHSLHGHRAAVTSVCWDSNRTVLFSGCDSGWICSWSLESGRLLRNLDCGDGLPVELVCTSDLLIGFGPELGLWAWTQDEGNLVFTSSLKDQTCPMTLLLDIDESVEPALRQGRFLAAVNDRFVVTSDVDSVQVWDIAQKTVIKQVKLPGPVDSLQPLDPDSALCCCGTNLFRIRTPPN